MERIHANPLSSPQHYGDLQADPVRGGRAAGPGKQRHLHACRIITSLLQEAVNSSVIHISFHNEGN